MNTRQFIKNATLANPWIYFFATYVWSWFFWGTAYVMGVSGETGGALGVILVLLALSGPMVTGILFTYSALTKEGQRDYWKRIFDYRLISAKWYVIIFLLVPVITILADMASGYWNTFSFSIILPTLFLTILTVPLVPIIEELGWRGYVLDRLQERYSALISSIIVGSFWGFWHLPVFFLKGSVFNLMPVGSLTFWLYPLNLTLISILFTWVYNNTGRSTLSAILLHITMELVANLKIFPWYNKQGSLYVCLFFFVAATIITGIFGSKTLVRKSAA